MIYVCTLKAIFRVTPTLKVTTWCVAKIEIRMKMGWSLSKRAFVFEAQFTCIMVLLFLYTPTINAIIDQVI